jgi:signal transduction histidine kinase
MENLYQKIIDTIPIFFFLWDGDKNETVFISEKFYDHTLDRYYAPETPREDLRQYITKESQEAYDHFFASLANNGNVPSHIELKANHLPGIEWIKLSTFPVVEPGKSTRYIAGHISDITPIRQHTQLLERQVENIDIIIFMLAHELSSPIANMMGLAEYLRTQAEKGYHEQPAQLYETIYNRGGEVLTLARGMVSLLNFQFNKEPFTFEKIAIKSFAEELVENFYHKSTAKNITITCSSIDKDIRVAVQAEKFGKAIEEILVFLLKMAEKNEEISLSASSADYPDQLKLFITTSAVNLSKQPIQLLLDNSARLSLSDLKVREVRGMLELVIAKEIIDLHQGSLELLYKDGAHGFVITIPTQPSHPVTS